MLLNKENTIEQFRLAVLSALDETAKDIFVNVGNNAAGATDSDLPDLFRCIDAHVEKLCARYEIALVPYDPSEYAKSNSPLSK